MERILMIKTSVDEKLLEEYKVILSEKDFKVATTGLWETK
jgi:hypothetical protein